MSLKSVLPNSTRRTEPYQFGDDQVTIQELSPADKERMSAEVEVTQTVTQPDGSTFEKVIKPAASNGRYNAVICCLGVVGLDVDRDLDELMRDASADEVEDCAVAIFKISGLGEDAKEEALKNSESTLSSDSSTA